MIFKVLIIGIIVVYVVLTILYFIAWYKLKRLLKRIFGEDKKIDEEKAGDIIIGPKKDNLNAIDTEFEELN